MIFGHNTNLTIGNITFHVQTEDRGEAHALIDTTVYYRGRVLHRRTNNYFDLLPLDEDRQQALRLRLDEQHCTVIEEIRSGELQLSLPPVLEAPHPAAQTSPSHPEASLVPGRPKALSLELTNAKSWLSGKHARLELTVREESGHPVPDARIIVEIEGCENGIPIQRQSGPMGQALIEFEMPRITVPHAALLIQAENHTAKGNLRFALRAKPRVV